MLTKQFIASALTIAMLIAATGEVSGQTTYPDKPIRFVTGDVGGSVDLTARLIAPGLTQRLGQPVVVVNIGGGIRSMVAVANAPPDGYNIYLTGTIYRPDPLPGENVPDLVRDFAPITLVSITPSVLVAHPSLPVKSAKELIALAKARPGQLDIATGSIGTLNHLAGELFKSMSATDVVIIPYKSSGEALNDLLGGQVQAGFYSAGAVTPHIKSGRMRALAVGSSEPSALFPGVPTIASSGLPGYDSVTLFGVFALAKTPPAIISRLNEEIVRDINQPDVKMKFLNVGLEPIGSSPEVLGNKVKAEIAKVRKLIKDTGIKLE